MILTNNFKIYQKIDIFSKKNRFFFSKKKIDFFFRFCFFQFFFNLSCPHGSGDHFLVLWRSVRAFLTILELFYHFCPILGQIGSKNAVFWPYFSLLRVFWTLIKKWVPDVFTTFWFFFMIKQSFAIQKNVVRAIFMYKRRIPTIRKIGPNLQKPLYFYVAKSQKIAQKSRFLLENPPVKKSDN